MSGNQIQFGIKMTFDGSDAGKIRPVSVEFEKLGDTAAKAGEKISGGMKEAATSSAQLEATLRNVPAQAQKVDAALKSNELSAKQMAFALRGVPAQFTDIATSLASGQAPMTVLLQQGGQLKDMFGGAAPAAKALGGYVAGMITPLNVTLAVSAALAVAWAQGDQEARSLNKSIILTGNAAGVTTGQLMAMSAGIATSTGATKAAAVEALDMLVATGKVSADSLNLAADTAIRMQRTTGKAISDTVQEYEQLGKTPVAAYEKLAQQYGFLSLAVRNQIKALEDQGRAQEAADLAQKSYTDAMQERTVKLQANLGTLEKSWLAMRDAAMGAWDAMKGIGRDEGIEGRLKEQIELVKKYSKALREAESGGDIEGAKKNRAYLQYAEASMRATLAQKRDEDAAETKKTGDQENARRDLANQKTVESLSLLAKKRVLLAQITDLEQTKNTPGTQAAREQSDAVTRIRQQIAGIDQELSGSRGYADYIKAQEAAAYKYQHDAITLAGAALDNRLKNNLVSYATYYDAKRELANQDNAAEIAKLKNEIVAEQNRGNKGTADERYQSKARLIDLQGQLNQAEADGAKQQSAINQQEKESAKKYADDKLGWTVSYLESQGKYEEDHAAKAEKQYQDMLAKMKKAGDVAGPEMAKAIFDSDKAKGQFEQINKDFSQSLADLSDAEKRIQIDQQAGLISEYEARQKLLELRGRFIPLMDAELAGLNAINQAALPPEMLQRAKAYKLQLDSIRGSASELNRTFEYGARNAFGQYMDEATNAGKQTEKVIGDGLHGAEDALANFVVHGKLSFSSMLDSMKMDLARFLSARYVMAPIVGSIAGMTGMSGVPAGASQSGMGIGGWMSAGSTANSAYNAFNGGMSDMYYNAAMSSYGQALGLSSATGATGATLAANGSVVSGMSGSMTAQTITGYELAANGQMVPVYADAAASGASVAGEAGGATLTSAGSAVGTAASYAGAALAGVALGSAIAGDKKVIGLDGTTTSAIGAAVGAVVAGPLGAVIGGVAGGIFNAAFGSSDREPDGSLKLQGKFGHTGFAGQYAQKWKEDGGWFSSDSSGTDYTAVSEKQAAAFKIISDTYESQFGHLAEIIGKPIDTSAWSHAIDNVADSEQAQKNILIELADAMGEQLIPDLTQFKRTGESLADTAVRLSDEFTLTNNMLAMMGNSASAFGAVGLESTKARENLIAFAGGMQNLSTELQDYYKNFYSPEEQLANTWKQIDSVFASVNVTTTRSKEGFRTAIEGLNKDTEAGQKALATLLGVEGQFAQAVDSAATGVSALTSALDTATQNLRNGIESEISAKQRLIDQMGKTVSGLRDYRNSLVLGALGGLSPKDRLDEARRQAEDVARRAQLAKPGDTAAMDQWQSVSTALLEASNAYNASNAAYNQDKYWVLDMSKTLEDTASSQADLQTQQVGVLKSQLATLGDIKNGVQSLADLWTTYNSAKAAVTAGGGTLTSGNVAQNATNPDGVNTVEGLYQTNLGRAADSAGLAYWSAKFGPTISAAEAQEFALAAIPEYKALHGFATGGVASRGMYVAGERGPEIIEGIGATRIYPAEQTSAIFNRLNQPAGGDNQETLAELRRQTALLMDMIDALVEEGRMTRDELADIRTRIAANDDSMQQLAVLVR